MVVRFFFSGFVKRLTLLLGVFLCSDGSAQSNDPTRPPVSSKLEFSSAPSSLNLQMIIVDDDKRKLAVINGATYHEKEMVGSYEIKEITPTCVILDQPGSDDTRLCAFKGFRE